MNRSFKEGEAEHTRPRPGPRALRPALTVDGLGPSRRAGLARLREAIVRRSMETPRDRPALPPGAC